MTVFRARVLVLGSVAVASALVFSACSTKKPDAKVAVDALNSGLKAQVQGKNSEAQKDYRQVLVHDPRNKFAYYNLGLIDQQSGRSQDAEKNYRLALQTDPRFVAALYNLAILRTGPDPKEAEALYRQAIAVAPNDPGNHLNLGFLLRSQGRNDEGDAEIARAVALNPGLGQAPAQPITTPAPTTTTTRH
jgi:tetratricopeptide (TPR) repeat protein